MSAGDDYRGGHPGEPVTVACYIHDFGPIPVKVAAIARDGSNTVLVLDARMNPRERIEASLEMCDTGELGCLYPAPRPD